MSLVWIQFKINIDVILFQIEIRQNKIKELQMTSAVLQNCLTVVFYQLKFKMPSYYGPTLPFL